ncbi:MAG: HAD family hydrolase [Pirellulaceae bacterium]|nr:HAD family hydrolase [Pirellulaceae bacterium]
MAELAGIIFDIDGTLVDSGLDFQRIRADMNLSDEAPILEAIAEMPTEEAARCRQVLARHEERGAAQGVPFPGVPEFLADLQRRGIRIAAVTRNRQELGQQMLARWDTFFDAILGRESGPIKPDPWSILTICEQWEVSVERVIFLGDFLFDMQAGRRAGAHTVLFSGGRPHESLDGRDLADYVLDSFLELTSFWQWVEKSL